MAGFVLGRGEFLAVVRGQAIHARDLSPGKDGRAETMLAAEVLRQSGHAPATPDAVAGEMDRLRAQFGEEQAFKNELETAQLSDTSLRATVSDHLEVRQWLEEQIAPTLRVTEEECRQRYERDRERFQLPMRYRASHLFVAAPEGTDAEILQAKRSLAQGLSMRLLAGEILGELAAEASEDDATKDDGGDLGYFSAVRMPPDFMTEVKKLTVGEPSSPVRCHLGFHIIELTEIMPARELSFAEARAEVAARLANEKRAQAVAVLADLVRRPEWSRVARSGH